MDVAKFIGIDVFLHSLVVHVGHTGDETTLNLAHYIQANSKCTN